MNDIVKHEKQNVQVTSHNDNSVGSLLIQMAKDPNVDVGKLQALIDMQEQMEDREAKRAFNSALVEFKKDPPRIIKNMAVSFGNTKYNHATIDSVMRQVDPSLHKHGLAFSWKVDVSPELVSVIGILRHEKGYSEENVFTSKPDDSGGKNKIQGQGSAVTYGKRYTVLAALGLAEQGEDDDGVKAYMKKTVDEIMVSELQDLIEKSGSDAKGLCKHFKVGSLTELSNQQYGAAKGILNAKLNKG